MENSFESGFTNEQQSYIYLSDFSLSQAPDWNASMPENEAFLELSPQTQGNQLLYTIPATINPRELLNREDLTLYRLQQHFDSQQYIESSPANSSRVEPFVQTLSDDSGLAAEEFNVYAQQLPEKGSVAGGVNSRDEKSYAENLLECFLESGPPFELTVQDIYAWFREKVPKATPEREIAWQKSIRYNLSKNNGFQKGSRAGGLVKGTWYLTDDAIRNGIQSTARYPKTADASPQSHTNSNPPSTTSPAKRAAGARGGNASRNTRKHKQSSTTAVASGRVPKQRTSKRSVAKKLTSRVATGRHEIQAPKAHSPLLPVPSSPAPLCVSNGPFTEIEHGGEDSSLIQHYNSSSDPFSCYNSGQQHAALDQEVYRMVQQPHNFGDDNGWNESYALQLSFDDFCNGQRIPIATDNAMMQSRPRRVPEPTLPSTDWSHWTLDPCAQPHCFTPMPHTVPQHSSMPVQPQSSILTDFVGYAAPPFGVPDPSNIADGPWLYPADEDAFGGNHDPAFTYVAGSYTCR